MNTTAHLLSLLLTPAALVTAAEPSLPPAAAQELAAIKDYLNTRAMPAAMAEFSPEYGAAFRPLVDECLALIAGYEATGSVQQASEPHRLTMLHLACLMQKPALVRALLAAGANPNARARNAKDDSEGDAPLVSCLYTPFPELPEPPAAARRDIADALLAAGAEVKGKTGEQALLIAATESFEGAEELTLRLLALGVGAQRRGGELGLLLRLLQYGGNSDRNAAAIALLLQQGADTQRDSIDGGWSAADLIHGKPRLLAALRERGFDIPRTPRPLRAETLREDLREHSNGLTLPPRESLLALWEDFSRLLLAPMNEAELRGDTVREELLRYMTDADAGRTADFIMALPQWQPSHSWSDEEALLFAALLKTKSLCLPTDWLVDTATRLEAAGRQREAHELIHLLARNGDAAAAAEALCASTRPALASAAWSVRLQQAGLDPLPDWWFSKERARLDRALQQRLERLAIALECLTMGIPFPAGHFLNFAHADNDFYHQRLVPGPNCEQALLTESLPNALPSEQLELVQTLRELNLEEAALYVAELFRLRDQLFAMGEEEEEEEPERKSSHEFADQLPPWLLSDESSPAEDDEADFDPDADYEEPDPGETKFREDAEWEIIDRFRELRESPDATRHAFDIEAALGRMMWDMFQQNKVISSESK